MQMQALPCFAFLDRSGCRAVGKAAEEEETRIQARGWSEAGVRGGEGGEGFKRIWGDGQKCLHSLHLNLM